MEQKVRIKYSVHEANAGESLPAMNHSNFSFDLIGWMMCTVL